MSTKAMYNLRETLCTDLEPYAKKGSLTRTDIDTVHMITDTIKNIDKIAMLEEEGSSYGGGMWNANGSYGNGMLYDGRYSGRRGRSSRDAEDYSDSRYMNDDYSHDMADRMRKGMNY